MQKTARLNALWAWRIMDGLAQAGAVHAVISPGSRSTPLTLAALRHPKIQTHIVLDERSAAFFALGLAKATGLSSILICTSGSAVANWHPAVIEAAAAQIPMILLSADRPPELQACGANQTIDQTRLFGQSLRAFHALPPAEANNGWLVNLMAQSVSESLWPKAGPVQINVALREPLLDDGGRMAPPPSIAAPPVVLPRTAPGGEALDAAARLIEGKRGIIVCGVEDMPKEAISSLAEALDAPILADPLSGMRFGPHDRSRVMTCYDLILRGGAEAPDYVLRFGAPPVSKSLAVWLDQLASPLLAAIGNGPWNDPARNADAVLFGDFDLVANGLAERVRHRTSPLWIGEFLAGEARIEDAVERCRPKERALIRTMIDQAVDGTLLFVGNSMAIRDFDAFSGMSEKAIKVMGNRGVSGIDGNLSTFLGAAHSGRFSTHLALVGDLTFLYDLAGLASGGINATIVVLANGGGGIFDYLAPGAQLPVEEYQKGWLTPQNTNIAAAAAAYGCQHIETTSGNFHNALAQAMAHAGISVVEVAIDREASIREHRLLWDALSKKQGVS